MHEVWVGNIMTPVKLRGVGTMPSPRAMAFPRPRGKVAMASMIRPDRAILKRQEEVAQPKLGNVFPEKNMVSTPSNDFFFLVNFYANFWGDDPI